MDFDESIPEPNEGTGEGGRIDYFGGREILLLAKTVEFFKAYRPVFLRNSKFYLGDKNQVPQLGDLNTPFDDVNHFYDFWLSFKSWREVMHPDEEKIEESMV